MPEIQKKIVNGLGIEEFYNGYLKINGLSVYK
jgi:hypothetical protein